MPPGKAGEKADEADQGVRPTNKLIHVSLQSLLYARTIGEFNFSPVRLHLTVRMGYFGQASVSCSWTGKRSGPEVTTRQDRLSGDACGAQSASAANPDYEMQESCTRRVSGKSKKTKTQGAVLEPPTTGPPLRMTLAGTQTRKCHAIRTLQGAMHKRNRRVSGMSNELKKRGSPSNPNTGTLYPGPHVAER